MLTQHETLGRHVVDTVTFLQKKKVVFFFFFKML